MPEPTVAIYFRLPDRLARKLDSAAARLGASKRDILSALVDDHLDIEDNDLIIRSHSETANATSSSVPEHEVLTVDEAATLLRVSADDVLSLVESGELRARRIGEHWRLTRTALMDWLRGDATTA